MKTRLIVLLIVLNTVVLALFHSLIKETPDEREVEKISEYIGETKDWTGRYAPDFYLQTLSGEDFRLADEVGKKVILLNFFATWCGPCRVEMPELTRYYQAHKNENFVLLGIDAHEERELVKQFQKEMKLTFPITIDSGVVERQYSLNGYPLSVLIGVDGKIQYYHSGMIENADVAFDSFLKTNREVLAKKEITTKEKYLAALEVQKKQDAKMGRAQSKDEELKDRAKHIAEVMGCVCGCNSKVIGCECQTATKIKKKLKTLPMDGKTDQEIILALNKEFCTPSEQKND